METAVKQEAVIAPRVLTVETNVGKWLGMPLTRYSGRLTELISVVPRFDRQPFRVIDELGQVSAGNVSCDAIVRAPMSDGEIAIPVGVVSTAYRLVQHRDLIEATGQALHDAGVDVGKAQASISLTTHGERMEFSVILPEDERFVYSIDGNDSMRCRLECFNSVDGSTRLMATMGWLRFVCRNGLVLGKSLAYLRDTHAGELDISRIGVVLRDGIERAGRERGLWDRWRETTIGEETLRRWADGSLCKRWGNKAAARTYAVCLTGWDLLVKPFEQAPPSQRSGEMGARVPGAPIGAKSAFDVAQALSWVAGQTKDLSKRIERTHEIPQLIAALEKRLAVSRN